ncbi:MAG TPA: hypothetical protein VKH43_02090, partial [Thermoanaerobaculia bacterium]|nr:hypothetical protein [Thermoanaerobaculia bacterium]
RVRASDGKLLETWTGATSALGILSAMGRILVAGETTPGNLYMIDPSQPAGAVTTVASTLGSGAYGIAFDGARVWTANAGIPASVSIVTPGATIPWTVTNVTTGFTGLRGALYDGANVWATDVTGTSVPGALRKLDANGNILATATVGVVPVIPVFDGNNIWVPNYNDSSVTVVRASNASVLATLTGNGLDFPYAAAFDGQRVLVTARNGNSVALWKAADLTTIGNFPTGAATNPNGACSDGIHFWVALGGTNQLARF